MIKIIFIMWILWHLITGIYLIILISKDVKKYYQKRKFKKATKAIAEFCKINIPKNIKIAKIKKPDFEVGAASGYQPKKGTGTEPPKKP